MAREKTYMKLLWISTILVLVICALQGWSGGWSTFYLVWPGSEVSTSFQFFTAKLAMYHMKMGYAIGIISVLIVIFAFLSKSNLYIRIFSILGLVVTAVAALGGYLFVTTYFADRLALGQMADASIGAFALYFILLFLLNRTPRFLLSRKKPTPPPTR
jgi:hypothetical protein